MALHRVAQRRLKSFAVELTLEPRRQRDRVGRARPFQPVNKPQPPLRIRQRNLGRTRNRTQSRTRRLLASKTLAASRYYCLSLAGVFAKCRLRTFAATFLDQLLCNEC